MKTESDINAERRLLIERRRRGMVLKLVREGHQSQLSRMDDFEVWSVLLKMGVTMGRDQVRTMLQDMQVLGYIDFESHMNEESGVTELSKIELTPLGLRLMLAGKSNDDIELR